MTEFSYWFRDVSDTPRFPTLSENINVDAIVIGGGIAGLSAAYFLSKAGIKTALLEANNIGSGDSGYTTAFATQFLDSLEATIATWDISKNGLNLLRQTITEEKIDCDWEDMEGICFTQKTDNDSQNKFLQTVKKLQKRDLSIEYLTNKVVSETVNLNVTAAYRKKENESQFHIRKFLIGLAKRAETSGTLIFENSEVIDIKRGNVVTVKTASGSIAAPWLVVATGEPAMSFFPATADNLTSVVSYILDVQYTGKKSFVPHALLWDDSEPYHYLRWVGPNEFLLGGEDWKMKEKKSKINPHLQLENWLTTICKKEDFKIINKWQGTLFYTPDMLPLIDSHPAYGKNIIFLTGFGGNGMTLGFLSGNIASDIIQQKKNNYQNLFLFNRF